MLEKINNFFASSIWLYISIGLLFITIDSFKDGVIIFNSLLVFTTWIAKEKMQDEYARRNVSQSSKDGDGKGNG